MTRRAWVHFVDWGVSFQPTTLPFLLAAHIDYLPRKRKASLAFSSVFVVMALWLFLELLGLAVGCALPDRSRSVRGLLRAPEDSLMH